MKNFLDKEYHPVIEDYIADYTEDALDHTEKRVFEELLVYDDDLRELSNSAKEGKKLLQQLGFIKARKGFEERLAKRIAGAR